VSVGRFLNHDNPNGFGAMASMTVPLAWKGSTTRASPRRTRGRSPPKPTAGRPSTTSGRDVELAYVRAKTALVLHDLFAGTHVPHAEQALRVTEAAYVTGGSDLTALSRNGAERERVHLEHVGAAADFERAYADLERAVGTDLPRATTTKRGGHHD
jgi:hypothetical protein